MRYCGVVLDRFLRIRAVRRFVVFFIDASIVMKIADQNPKGETARDDDANKKQRTIQVFIIQRTDRHFEKNSLVELELNKHNLKKIGKLGESLLKLSTLRCLVDQAISMQIKGWG